MAGDKVRNQLLLRLAGGFRGLLELLGKCLEIVDLRFFHRLQHTTVSMLGGHLEAAADMMSQLKNVRFVVGSFSIASSDAPVQGLADPFSASLTRLANKRPNTTVPNGKVRTAPSVHSLAS